MRQVYIKTSYRGNLPQEALSQPVDKLGYQNPYVTVSKINNVPGDITPAKVVNLFANTAIFPSSRTRFEFDFSEIGYGKIIK